MMGVGELLAGRYRLIRRLGAGSMGQVWLAEDTVIGRQVAIKRLLLDEASVEQEDVERSMREARLAGRLSSPYAVALHDVVMDGGHPSLVMEYVDGPTLAQVLRTKGPMSPADARRVIAQVVEAVAAAHKLGIIHRDIKPANVLMAPDGRAKLADFGIARSGADSSLTATGSVLGTLAYMSPEMAAGEPASPASDMWSVGATLFSMLEGKPPFAGHNAVDTLRMLLGDAAPQSTKAGELSAILTRLLDRDATQRPSAADLLSLLAQPNAELAGASPLVEVATPEDVSRTSPRDVSTDTVRRTVSTHHDTEVGGPPIRVDDEPAVSVESSDGKRGSGRRRWPVVVAAAALILGGLVVVPLLVGNNGGNGKAVATKPANQSSRSASASPSSAVVRPAGFGAVPSGTVYVLNQNDPSVSVWSPAAKSAVSVRLDGTPCTVMTAPAGTAMAGAGYITTGAGSGSGTLWILGGTKVLAKVPFKGESCGVTIAPSGTPNAGTVYVPVYQEGSAAGEILVFSATGKLLNRISGVNFVPAMTVAPAGTPNAGNLYVESADGTISMLSPSGKQLGAFAVGSSPHGITVAPAGTPAAGRVYVSNLGDNTVSVVSPEGGLLATVRVDQQPSAPVIAPAGTSRAGTVYVPNGGGSVSVMSPSGNLLGAIRGGTPFDVVVAPAGTPAAGTVYVSHVADGSKAGTVVIASPTGKVISTVAVGRGSKAMAVGPKGSREAGYVYVANYVDNTISVITPAGKVARTLKVGVYPSWIAVVP